MPGTSCQRTRYEGEVPEKTEAFLHKDPSLLHHRLLTTLSPPVLSYPVQGSLSSVPSELSPSIALGTLPMQLPPDLRLSLP